MRLLLFACAVLIAAPSEARPVTYPGGSMSMTEVNGGNVIIQVDHTVSRTVALGGYALSESSGDRLSTGMIANWLAARRNAADSQANAYVMAGIGPSWVRRDDGRGRDTVASGWLAAEADWETRRLFFGGMGVVSVVGGEETQLGYRLRAGVAPYVAPAGALHTWLFVQVGRAATAGRKTEVTPVIRLFKGSVLAEAGVSSRGNAFGTLWFYF